MELIASSAVGGFNSRNPCPGWEVFQFQQPLSIIYKLLTLVNTDTFPRMSTFGDCVFTFPRVWDDASCLSFSVGTRQRIFFAINHPTAFPPLLLLQKNILTRRATANSSAKTEADSMPTLGARQDISQNWAFPTWDSDVLIYENISLYSDDKGVLVCEGWVEWFPHTNIY